MLHAVTAVLQDAAAPSSSPLLSLHSLQALSNLGQPSSQTNPSWPCPFLMAEQSATQQMLLCGTTCPGDKLTLTSIIRCAHVRAVTVAANFTTFVLGGPMLSIPIQQPSRTVRLSVQYNTCFWMLVKHEGMTAAEAYKHLQVIHSDWSTTFSQWYCHCQCCVTHTCLTAELLHCKICLQLSR